MLRLAIIGAFAAAAVFLGLAAFTVALGDVPEIAAGLFCMALGFFMERVADVRDKAL